jgi:hypothetical protein
MTRTVDSVTAQELPSGDWLVTAIGEAGTWFACGNLVQATGEATYGAMIGEAPTQGTPCAQDGFHGYILDPITLIDERVPAREWVIRIAAEMRATQY